MADGSVPIVLSPEPFARSATYAEAPAGCTVRTAITEAVRAGSLSLDDLKRTSVYIDGERLDRDKALDRVLAEGQIVNVVVEPLGGGGGGSKDIGQVLLTIAVIAVSAWVGGGGLGLTSAFWTKVAAASVMAAGQAAIAALYAPESASQARANDRYALQSASNQFRQWGPMPLALGEVVAAPDLVAKTFTQNVGDESWIYGILGLHYGPCTVEELKIGDTLVSSMGSADVRIAQHLTPGPRTFSIVPNDIDQLDLQEELTATTGSATPVVRAASAEGEKFEFDFYLPMGLYYAKDDGRKVAAQVTATVRYRPIDANGNPTGSGSWTIGLTVPLNAATNEPMRVMRSLSLPLGRYQFEVKRSVRQDNNAKRKDDIYWTAVRAVAFRKPVADETLSIIEFAVRATALNQGTLAPITCRITPVCPTWTGTQWGPAVRTSNPAALVRWLMTGPAPALPLTALQADQGLRAWAALCDQYNWESHIYLTDDRKQDVVLGMLGRAGRAGIFWDGTQLVAAPWVEKPAPRQLFAGGNLKDHRWTNVYPDEVHALRVEFLNIDQAGEPDELYVYADGYAETAGDGKQAATLVEALRIDGQMTLERAYREGRWALGQRIHQRRIDTWSTDIEHVVSRFGDRVRLAWDRVNGTDCRVRCRRWSGSLVSGLRLAHPVTMEPGQTYAMDMRLGDQLVAAVPVVNPATTEPIVTREVAFASPRAANVSPVGGDLVAFGTTERLSEDVEIIGIEPGQNLTANITAIRYVAPLLMQGETGPIPPLQSKLTGDRAKDPPAPSLLGVDASLDGVRLGFSMLPWKGSPISAFTVRWRPKPAPGEVSAWSPLPDLPATAMILTTPPLRELPGEDEVTRVEIEIVAVTVSGRVSKPLSVTAVVPVIDQPAPDSWQVEARPVAADGSQQPVLVVWGSVADPAVAQVSISYGLTSAGPWMPSYEGAPSVTMHEITGLISNAEYWVLVTYYSAQGVPSQSLVLGPRVAPTLSSGIPPEVIEGIVSDVVEQVDTDIGEGLAIGQEALDRAREALARARDNALLILQNAKNALEGTLKEEQDRETQTDDLQDRIDIGFLIDPVAKTGIIRSVVKVEGLNETFVQMNTRLVARDAENALQTAQVALDAQVYTNDKVAIATANLVTAAQMGTAISGAVLSMQSYADDKVAQATAGLATVAQLNGAISTATLALQSYTDGRISEATANLVAEAELATALAASELSLRAYTDGQISEATADLVSAAELAGAIAGSELSLRAYTDGQISTATASLISAVAVDAKIATASLSLSSEIDTKVATATADLVSAAELAGAIAGSELSMQAYTDGQISEATALLASKAEVQTRGNAVPNSTGANGWAGWSQHASWAIMSDATWGARFETSATGTTNNLSDRFAVQSSATYVLSSDFLFFASGGAVVVDVQWETSGGSVIGVSSRIFTNTTRDYGERKSVQITAPSNASHARIRFFGEAVTGNTRIGIRRIKLERGAAPATAWTDEATDLQLSATAAIALEAANDAATKLSQARLRLIADPGGGQPAVVELFSDNTGSNYIRLAAKQIGFGDSTAFEDATDTLRSETGSVGRITAWGPPFGPDSLVYWEGPAGIATTAATKANAEAAGGQWRDSTGASYFGGKTLAGPFDSGAGSTVTVPSTAYVDVAVAPAFRTISVSQILTYLTGTVRMQAPADPESGASAAWRVVHTDTSGGDVVVMRSGAFLAAATGSIVSQSVESLITQANANWWASVAAGRSGERVVRFQLARSGPTIFLDIQTPRVRGFYAT